MKQLVENKKRYNVIRKEGGYFENIKISGKVKTGSFSRANTRFEIILVELDDYREKYLVSLPYYYFSIVTSRPHDIAYKLIERRVMNEVDAESVEIALEYLKNKGDAE